MGRFVGAILIGACGAGVLGLAYWRLLILLQPLLDRARARLHTAPIRSVSPAGPWRVPGSGIARASSQQTSLGEVGISARLATRGLPRLGRLPAVMGYTSDSLSIDLNRGADVPGPDVFPLIGRVGTRHPVTAGAAPEVVIIEHTLPSYSSFNFDDVIHRAISGSAEVRLLNTFSGKAGVGLRQPSDVGLGSVAGPTMVVVPSADSPFAERSTPMPKAPQFAS